MRVSKEVFGDEIRIIRIIESFVQYMIRKTNEIAICLLKLTNYRELTKYPGTNYTEFTVGIGNASNRALVRSFDSSTVRVALKRQYSSSLVV